MKTNHRMGRRPGDDGSPQNAASRVSASNGAKIAIWAAANPVFPRGRPVRGAGYARNFRPAPGRRDRAFTGRSFRAFRCEMPDGWPPPPAPSRRRRGEHLADAAPARSARTGHRSCAGSGSPGIDGVFGEAAAGAEAQAAIDGRTLLGRLQDRDAVAAFPGRVERGEGDGSTEAAPAVTGEGGDVADPGDAGVVEHLGRAHRTARGVSDQVTGGARRSSARPFRPQSPAQGKSEPPVGPTQP